MRIGGAGHERRLLRGSVRRSAYSKTIGKGDDKSQTTTWFSVTGCWAINQLTCPLQSVSSSIRTFAPQSSGFQLVVDRVSLLAVR